MLVTHSIIASQIRIVMTVEMEHRYLLPKAILTARPVEAAEKRIPISSR